MKQLVSSIFETAYITGTGPYHPRRAVLEPRLCTRDTSSYDDECCDQQSSRARERDEGYDTFCYRGRIVRNETVWVATSNSATKAKIRWSAVRSIRDTSSAGFKF